MWDSLENYMVSSRDHENGKCSIQSDGVTDDEQLLARLYLWVFQLGSHRVSQQARVGLKLCISRPNAKAVVNEFIKIAFDDRDVVVEALRLLHDGRNKPLWNDWRDEILQHANSFDLGVSILARQILEQNGISLERHPQTRPVFYDLEIPVDPSGESEPISDIDFEPMRLDDALGWTKPFLNIVEILSEQFEVSAEHIRYRCAQFINQWGGVEKFGKTASENQDSSMEQLNLRIDRNRPHIRVALLALRNVAGELFLTSNMTNEETFPILYHLGQPSVRPEFINQIPRPEVIQLPLTPNQSWGKELEEWMAAVSTDKPPHTTGNYNIIAEIMRFNETDMRYSLTMDRITLPHQPVNQFESLEHCLRCMPNTIYNKSIQATYPTAASCPIVKLTESQMIEFPTVRFTLCPYHVHSLGWLEHPDSSNVFVDALGIEMVRIQYWRDSTQIDAGESNSWAEGILVCATQEGTEQLFPKDANLTLFSRAWRTYTTHETNSKTECSHFDF